MKYRAVADAVERLGSISSIRSSFIDFQGYLYDTKRYKFFSSSTASQLRCDWVEEDRMSQQQRGRAATESYQLSIDGPKTKN